MEKYITPQQKKAVILRGKGYTYSKIAEEMGLNVVAYVGLLVREGFLRLGVDNILDAYVKLGIEDIPIVLVRRGFKDRWKEALSYHWAGKDNDWIANKMGISRKTVGQYLSRAKNLSL